MCVITCDDFISKIQTRVSEYFMIRNESKCTEDHSYVISVSRQLERAKGMPIHEFLFITVVMYSHHMVDKCKRRFFLHLLPKQKC